MKELNFLKKKNCIRKGKTYRKNIKNANLKTKNEDT